MTGPDDARAILDALAHQDPLRLRYRDDDEFHDECVYCEAEPSAGEEHDPERCLHLRARAIAARVPRGDYATGWREGEQAAGRRAGREMGRRFRRQQEAQERAAAAEDRRRRAKLSGELGSGAALSWEEIARRIAELHRERYHFEALARDAEARLEALCPPPPVMRPEWRAAVDLALATWAKDPTVELHVPRAQGAAEVNYLMERVKPLCGGMTKAQFVGLTGLELEPPL